LSNYKSGDDFDIHTPYVSDAESVIRQLDQVNDPLHVFKAVLAFAVTIMVFSTMFTTSLHDDW
jgi:hypothetical protein